MNVLSLFAGIGGLELGLERAGMTVVGQVEIDPWCRRLLAKHWPDVSRHDDVRTAAEWWTGEERPDVDLVCGGFPCQPVSIVGRRQKQADARWLWPEMASIIDRVRPRWVLWENVPGLLSGGLDIVHGDLIRLGYRHRVGWASACSVGAPHMRRRLLGVAHTGSEGWSPRRLVARGQSSQGIQHENRSEPAGSAWWAVEPGVRRVAYGIPSRLDRCRALGNAVVPQVAEHVGRLIMAA